MLGLHGRVSFSLIALGRVDSSCGARTSPCSGVSSCGAWTLGREEFSSRSSWAPGHRFSSCSAACGIFPNRGSNPYPLHWQVNSYPLYHQRSPALHLLSDCFNSSLYLHVLGYFRFHSWYPSCLPTFQMGKLRLRKGHICA